MTVPDCDCYLQKEYRRLFGWANSPIEFYPTYETDQVKAFLAFKIAVDGEEFFAIHVNGEHITNIFVNGISLRRLIF